MRLAIICYLGGVTIALLQAAPPSLALIAGAAPLAALSLAVPRTRCVGALLCGVVWGGWHVGHYAVQRAALIDAGPILHISGMVASFAQTSGARRVFELEPRELHRRWWPPAPAARLRLSNEIDDSLQPRLGQWCELYVRVRRAHALTNPTLRDAERGYVARRIVAFAAIVQHPGNLCLDIAPRYLPHRLRQWISARITSLLPPGNAAAAVRALAVADRSALDDTQWQRMRATGTTHLLAISGLHISLAALWVFAVVRGVAALLGCRRQTYPALRLGWWGAGLAACAYAGLAGFGIPATRAAVMVLCAAGAALLGRRALGYDTLLLAALVLTLCDPFALLAEGLWLSFAAVAILLVVAERHESGTTHLRVAWRTHCALALGLGPLLALIYGEIPLLSPLANLFAVPWCSFLVVPLVLAGTALCDVATPAAALLLGMAGYAWLALEAALEVVAGFETRLMSVGWIGASNALPLLLAAALLMTPAALAVRALAAILLVAVLCTREPQLEHGAYSVTLLDVGQGLAAIVRTRGHIVLYDTGPRWRGNSRSAGHTVVAPVLAAQRRTRLDALVISHGDSDHAGGLAAIQTKFAIDAGFAPAGSELTFDFTPCRANRGWHWDGVEFVWLHPHTVTHGTRNDQSCVLAVRSAYGRVLLSGDIERDAERDLLGRAVTALAADVLVVPHHGSRTSSSAAFVRAVAPRFALISAAHSNRYGLPHAEVVRTYSDNHARVLNTASAGAISVQISAAGFEVQRERWKRRGFWLRLGLTTP